MDTIFVQYQSLFLRHEIDKGLRAFFLSNPSLVREVDKPGPCWSWRSSIRPELVRKSSFCAPRPKTQILAPGPRFSGPLLQPCPPPTPHLPLPLTPALSYITSGPCSLEISQVFFLKTLKISGGDILQIYFCLECRLQLIALSNWRKEYNLLKIYFSSWEYYMYIIAHVFACVLVATIALQQESYRRH